MKNINRDTLRDQLDNELGELVEDAYLSALHDAIEDDLKSEQCLELIHADLGTNHPIVPKDLMQHIAHAWGYVLSENRDALPLLDLPRWSMNLKSAGDTPLKDMFDSYLPKFNRLIEDDDGYAGGGLACLLAAKEGLRSMVFEYRIHTGGETGDLIIHLDEWETVQ